MLSNKTAVITGCNKGIGKAILNLFASHNCNIWACTRIKNDDFLDEIKLLEQKHNIWIKNICFDFANEVETINASKSILNQSEDIDILVNNAGIIDTSLFQMTKIENIKKLFDINFFSQLTFTQIIIKKMIRKKAGSIVNIASTSAFDANVGRLAYSSSKSALITASNVLSKELSNFNIRVNSIAPGLTNTDLMKNSHPNSVINETINRISLKRIAQPSEIADLVLFLVSDSSKYITGQTIRVDGGMQ